MSVNNSSLTPEVFKAASQAKPGAAKNQSDQFCNF